MDGSGKTVGAVVANLDSVRSGLELGNGAYGAENLLLHYLHVLTDVAEDGGLDEVAFVPVSLATNLDLGARLLAFVNVAVDTISIIQYEIRCRKRNSLHDAIELQLRDLWALERLRLVGCANHVLLCALLEGL